jgi:alpha-glucosidase
MIRFANRVESLQPVESGFRLSLDGGQSVVFTFVAGNLLRVAYTPPDRVARATGAVSNGTPDRVPVQFTDSGSTLTFAMPAMRVSVNRDPFRITLLWPDGAIMARDHTPSFGYDDASGRVFNQRSILPGERLLGAGARGGPLDRRGRQFVFFNVDRAEYKELDDPLYLSFPLYYSIAGGRAYGLFLDNAATPFFDLGKGQADVALLAAAQGNIDFYIAAGPSPGVVAASMARILGTMPLPPKWALGYHQSRYSYLSEGELGEVASRLRQSRIPCDVLWLDIDYMDRFRNLTWDPERFPDPRAMCARLERDGFARVAIVEPCVKTDDPWWEELAAKRHVLTDAARRPVVNTIWYGDVGWMDFSLSPFRAWYKDKLKAFLDVGIDGIWNDLNEPARNVMPEAVYDFDGERRTDEEARNLYALKVTELSHQAMSELRPNRRPWIISRSGFSGIQRYSANWSGDASATWESLRTNIQMSLGMAASGQTFFGHDTGGFLGSPDGELFVRWLQFSLFTPLFRNHADKDSAPREPWAFADPFYGIIKSTIEERYRLLPFLYSAMEAASRIGDPLVIPPAFDYPGDDALYSRNLDLLVGHYLLVAPVAEPGARERAVRLPAGLSWFEPPTGAWHRGGQEIRVAAPLDRIPVLIREGSLIPRGPLVQHTREEAPTTLDLAVYPGRDTAFDLYEDDGISLDYTRGQFLRTRLSLTHGLDGITVSTRRAGGALTPARRTWNVAVNRVLARPRSVSLNGRPAQEWRWDERSALLSMPVETDAGEFTLVVRP